MPSDPHSIEFHRLVMRWLDETATAEEAARLWDDVAQSTDCAREFAAVSRFESLLRETVVERAGEERVLAAVAAVPMPSTITPPKPARRPVRFVPSHVIRMAAALCLLGLMAWLAWPAPRKGETVRTPAKGNPGSLTASASKGEVQTVVPVSHGPLPTGTPGSSAPAVPLIQRLDTFFLSAVSLDQMPLSQALGVLQGQLQELNFLNTEDLKKLRVTVPADAAGRRVTFHSGPIAFLKAVRAVAALGGCDVTVDERTLALLLHQEIFPQIAEKRDVRDLLKGRVNADGSAAIKDPARLAALVTDAAALGIPIAQNSTPDSLANLPVTRGQWEALLMLTAAREQLGTLLAPSLQLYITEVDPNHKDKDGALDDEETKKIRDAQRQGGLPFAVLTPVIGPFTAADMLPFSMTPAGDHMQLSIQPANPNAQPEDSAPKLIVANTNTNINFNGNTVNGGGTYNGSGLSTTASTNFAELDYKWNTTGISAGTRLVHNGNIVGTFPNGSTLRITGYTYDQVVAMIQAAGGILSVSSNNTITATLGNSQVDVIIVPVQPPP